MARPNKSPAAAADQSDTDLASTQVDLEDDSDDAAPLPAAVKLKSFYAFYDDQNLFRSWHEGLVVTDPQAIRTLIERQAPVEAQP